MRLFLGLCALLLMVGIANARPYGKTTVNEDGEVLTERGLKTTNGPPDPYAIGLRPGSPPPEAQVTPILLEDLFSTPTVKTSRGSCANGQCGTRHRGGQRRGLFGRRR